MKRTGLMRSEMACRNTVSVWTQTPIKRIKTIFLSLPCFESFIHGVSQFIKTLLLQKAIKFFFLNRLQEFDLTLFGIYKVAYKVSPQLSGNANWQRKEALVHL